jgi:HTH-type transcriptional regulator, sugar sensing transcriptional regulator
MVKSGKLAAKLMDLGFSQDEAVSYVALLNMFGQTAYALGKATGVPQPKVYEAVRKLVDRGAAVQVGDEPARFAAVPPDKLLQEIEDGFQDRLAAARREMRSQNLPDEWPVVINSVTGRAQVLARAASLLETASRKAYLSAWDSELETLRPNLDRAQERGVELIVLTFGPASLDLEYGQVFKHSSTGGILYPHHQNRHLALIVDGTTTLWATAPSGTDWSALTTDDRRVIGLTRSFIRHDIYVQKVHSHLRTEMEALFGPGLEYMMDVSSDRTLAPPRQTGTSRRRSSAG